MTSAAEKIKARLAKCSTKDLLEMAFALATPKTSEEVYVSVKIDTELERRMSEDEFAEYLASVEAILDAAA